MATEVSNADPSWRAGGLGPAHGVASPGQTATGKAAGPQGGGEMGERIRAFDWASTPLGAMESWSPALQTMVRILLANRFPHILWWGPHYIQLYNDAYRPILGAKHPHPGLGRSGWECWAEIWPVIGPLVDRPFRGGPATWDEDILLEVRRHGFVEESHFTIAYSPVPDDTVPSGIGGVLATVHEITQKVVGERRVAVLRDLGARVSEAKTAREACALAAETLAGHAKDVPFALLYLIETERNQARLAGVAGVQLGAELSPETVALEGEGASEAAWPLAEALRSESIVVVPELASRFAGPVPPGPWTDPPSTAVVVPIRSNKAHCLAGFLVAGVSARLKLDEPYRDFFNLVASQIATGIANAREYEEERKRAEALAEIDRAKTLFFSNVSHEFRTPLTLMLGPVEDLLTQSPSGLSPLAREHLGVVNRNAKRLLRLVNTLLDFSRIEAGRVEAVFEATELGEFTRELASVFRSATQRAGLELKVDCPELAAPVYVDREMWEKIVLNLLSNAFKFTFAGGIEVQLRTEATCAVLTVKDTGVGIPAEAMLRLFERFHRVPHARSRTHEGSGIGLALVQELVRLHQGSITAESRVGHGTVFRVSVPLGVEHLPAEHVGRSRGIPSAAVAAPFVEEALRWLPEGREETSATDFARREAWPPATGSGSGAGEPRPRVLVADDNADMCQYVARLLAECCQVQTARDGLEALAAARERRPDLVVSDVMMPNLDGFGLVRELRADAQLKTVPIILLSARAGEESRVEGMQQGADDYLVKPFSARELRARVAAHLEMARLRREAGAQVRESEERLRLAVEATELGTWDYNPRTGALRWNARCKELFGLPPEAEMTYDTFLAGLHPEDRERTHESVQRALAPASGGLYDIEYRTVGLRDGGKLRWIRAMGKATFDESGRPVRLIGMAQDITERKAFQEELERLVAERTAKLKELVGELEHFSYSITHDMRAPLRGMQGFAEAMAEALQEGDRAEAERFLKRIGTSAARMDLLITDALQYAKAVRQELPLAPVEVGPLLRGMVDSYPEFQTERAQIEIAEGLPRVMGNEAGLT